MASHGGPKELIEMQHPLEVGGYGSHPSPPTGPFCPFANDASHSESLSYQMYAQDLEG